MIFRVAISVASGSIALNLYRASLIFKQTNDSDGFASQSQLEAELIAIAE